MGDRDGGPGLIGGSATASKVRQVTKGPISAAGNAEALSGADAGPAGTRRRKRRSFASATRLPTISVAGGKAGRRSWSSQEGPRNIGPL